MLLAAGQGIAVVDAALLAVDVFVEEVLGVGGADEVVLASMLVKQEGCAA